VRVLGQLESTFVSHNKCLLELQFPFTGKNIEDTFFHNTVRLNFLEVIGFHRQIATLSTIV
ncbi:hypothetical protein NQ318_018731, partial [Aromia moschata]